MNRLAGRSDPIAAVATASGRGAIGIVRASGRGLEPLARALVGASLQARHAHFVRWGDAQGAPIDEGLVLWFPGPHSATGEDVLELQGHGGPVVGQLTLARVIELARTLPGLERMRPAGPGEFTERAFLNGKIDLVQAEAVADLIDAQTEAAARGATRSLQGAFSREALELSQALTQLRVQVEAGIDFPEEELDLDHVARIHARLDGLRAQLAALRERARQGRLLHDGLTLVLIGQPNVGKSSLLNALAGAELAIVTPIAGTTRDRVQGRIQIDGMPVHVVDTAGLRADAEASDEVERIGIRRSWQALQEADVVLWLHDAQRESDPGYAQAEAMLGEQLDRAMHDAGRRPVLLHARTKVDTRPATQACPPAADGSAAAPLALAAPQGLGLPELRAAMKTAVGAAALTEGQFMARERHLDALDATARHLDEGVSWAELGLGGTDRLAEELRLAAHALGQLTGEFTADDLLGAIFVNFCIGK